MTRTYLKDLTPEEVVRRLKNGERVYIEKVTSSYYAMIDGVLCQFDENGDIFYNSALLINDTSKYKKFFETEETFKITHTGLYKTRDGRKAFISFIDKEYDINSVAAEGVIENSDRDYSWTLQGHLYGLEKSYDEDIIAEWSEENEV